jgi:hypothetical protein
MSEVTFGMDDREDMVVKSPATVRDLINALSQFPDDLPIYGNFLFHVEDQKVLYIYDERCNILLKCMLECPICKNQIDLETVEIH